MRIVFLGRLADAVGETERQIDLPPEVDNVEALRDWLGRGLPALLDPRVRLIVNDVIAHHGQPVSANDEVAFFPPLGGG